MPPIEGLSDLKNKALEMNGGTPAAPKSDPAPAPKADATPTPKAAAPDAAASLAGKELQKAKAAKKPDAPLATTGPVETTVEAPKEEPAALDAPLPTTGEPATPAGEFTPDFKLKVMDQEMEIPDFLKPLITDEKTQKEIKQFAAKALGLDYAKPKHEALKQEHVKLQETHHQVASRMGNWEQNLVKLQNASAADPNSADFKQFLSFWKIPKEKLYQYAAMQLHLDENPEARTQIESAEQAELRARQAQEQAQYFQGRYQTQAVQIRLGEVDRLVSSRADILDVARELGQRKNDPQAFKKLVTRIGTMTAMETGKDLSAEEAIRETMSFLGYEEVAGDAQGQPAQAAPAGAQAPAQAPILAPVQQKKLPVIPSLGSGSGSAPVQQVATSIADLKKKRQDMLVAK